jgi:hypothetical protein
MNAIAERLGNAGAARAVLPVVVQRADLDPSA